MARNRYYVAASADGYIADQQNSLEWLFEVDFDEHESSMDGFMSEVGALAMGADTYSWMLANVGDGWPYSGIPTWVFTHRELAAFPGADLTFIRGDVTEWIGDITEDAGEKDVWVVGGGSLAGQFVDAGLLDELILFSMPVILGGGRPLFAMRGRAPLVQTSSVDYGGGVRETRYDVVKRPASGRNF
jgi:dihydrofolate reductase